MLSQPSRWISLDHTGLLVLVHLVGVNGLSLGMNGVATMGSSSTNHLRVCRYDWYDKTTLEHEDCIAFIRRSGGQVVARMDAQQARAMADKLHDLADALEQDHE